MPEDSQTVVTSANKGFPFVMTRTETKVAKAIIDMGYELMKEMDGGSSKKVAIAETVWLKATVSTSFMSDIRICEN